MLYTCSHKNCKTDILKTYAISGNRGKDVNYQGKCYPKLAPKLSFWKVWHNNIGKISEEENNKYYIEQYYSEVLSKLDPEEIYKELNNSILLCYENNEEFCHRHIVAAWLELLLGIEVLEVKINDMYIEEIVRPEYIKEYLEEFMKKNLQMHKFNSLQAAYIFRKSEELIEKANKLELETGKCYDLLRQEACFMRCDADQIEEEYRYNNIVKILNKRKR